MTKFYKLMVCAILFAHENSAYSQQTGTPKMLRVYEENDFFNIRGNGTDKAYSNGTRFDLFCEKENARGFVHRLMPKAGAGSNNVYAWSVMQIMVTPKDISESKYIPNDYYYAGALFITHSLYSYNPKKKYGFQTELLAGVRGPASLAKQTQRAFHRLVDYQEPMGWDNQLRHQPLLNITCTFEKSLVSVKNVIEINVGSQLRAGSLMDLVMFYPMLRVGRMSPYFAGYIKQYGSYSKNGKKIKTRYYFVIKPAISFIAYNAMLRGKRRNGDKDYSPEVNEVKPSIHNDVFDVQFGGVVAHGNFAISLMQTNTSAYNEGIDSHTYGNLSLYFTL